ncbi:hypothetical protein [Synechococcus sp. CBW1004]|uniref:hypothetical protein n=1 Tax=Synechococcus sp. CBW1004 TaxID=1353136 RepID=UPI001E4A4307|nr:hypothetical protein [Synechococcus sp. CBW1004]
MNLCLQLFARGDPAVGIQEGWLMASGLNPAGPPPGIEQEFDRVNDWIEAH